MKLNPPMLTLGPLTDRVYVVTHGKVESHPTLKDRTMVTASVKYDVTDQFMMLVSEREHSNTAFSGATRTEHMDAGDWR